MKYVDYMDQINIINPVQKLTIYLSGVVFYPLLRLLFRIYKKNGLVLLDGVVGSSGNSYIHTTSCNTKFQMM